MSQITDELLAEMLDEMNRRYIRRLECKATLEQAAARLRALSTPPVGAETGEDKLWRTMDSAPLDGKHCILAVPEPGGFIYSVQGAYDGKQWNCVHRDNVRPLYWMPNKLLPEGWETLAQGAGE